MIERIDRVVLAVQDAAAVAGRWCALVDAEKVREDAVPELGARRTVLAVGDAELEILEPTGPGVVRDHVERRRGGPFAAGMATADLDGLLAHLAELGIHGVRFGDQCYLDAGVLGIPGLSVVVSPLASRPRVGLLRNLYEVTHLTAEPRAAAEGIARVFGLEQRHFVPIRSEQYGYDGYLTLFDPDALDRIETIDPYDRSKTMGRYFEKFGPTLYMCYGETDDLPAVRERLLEHAPGGWTGSLEDNNGLFVHPPMLGGVMLGVSRTSYGWTWSGSPERVLPQERS